ncbi:hypothetical protein [Colwellia sp. UCD-KL20]|uniref:hypothetical protein n=1 Tax=Colwellia sp. UCD-KL20 TaxID=1917165 RepID=UPI000970C269|nr:hypothetical protein [Colwellia sp. UCD-KL20]
MKELKYEEFHDCILNLSVANSTPSAIQAWSLLQGRHENLKCLIALDNYERQNLPPAIKKYTRDSTSHLIPYFYSENIYFLSDQILFDMHFKEEAAFEFDYTLMFDTNIASYINRLIRGEGLGTVQNKMLSLVDDLLRDDLNFDHIFYLVENVKNILKIIEKNSSSPLKFWKLLDKQFRQNMVSLQLFRSIDCKQYKKTLNPIPQFSYLESVRRAVNYSFDFYCSKNGRAVLDGLVLLQRTFLLILINMIKVNVSSNKQSRAKIQAHFEFIQTNVGVYLDRELVIAHKYFSKPSELPILKKIHKGCKKKRLLKLLDNIAWDMMAPRFMEKLIANMHEDKFFLPFFLTFDSGLKDLLNLYPVKGCIYNSESKNLIPIPKDNSYDYFESAGCLREIEFIQSDEAKLKRQLMPTDTRLSIHKKIADEYRLLRKSI